MFKIYSIQVNKVDPYTKPRLLEEDGDNWSYPGLQVPSYAAKDTPTTKKRQKSSPPTISESTRPTIEFTRGIQRALSKVSQI